MTGRLTQIEALWAQEYGPEEIDPSIIRDVLALVEIARAAQEWANVDSQAFDLAADGLYTDEDDAAFAKVAAALRAALVRLETNE